MRRACQPSEPSVAGLRTARRRHSKRHREAHMIRRQVEVVGSATERCRLRDGAYGLNAAKRRRLYNFCRDNDDILFQNKAPGNGGLVL